MRKSLVTACGGLLIMAFAAGCGTTQAPSAPGSASPSPATSQSRPAPSATPSHAAAPVGGQVPAGFEAASVTFVSTQEAFVLGTAPCVNAPCTSIIRTLDRGESWRGLPAPVVPLGEPGATGPAVWGIRFATPGHGFVFGNGLWVTTDGGEHWSAAAYPGGSILSLEIVRGQVLAVTADRGTELGGSALWRRALGGGAWQRVSTLAGPADIATQAGVAAILDGSSVLVTGNGGLTFARHALGCPGRGLPSPASVAVEAPRGLALLCTGEGYTGHTDKTVYTSGDLGATWRLAGHPASAGDAGVIAASAPGHLVIATASAASWLYYSADNGTTWRTVVTYGDGGMGWNDLGFTSVSDGVVIHGRPAAGNMTGQLLLTGNGGLSWHAVNFS